MPLQIRRGTDAERQLLAVPLADGELLWTTDLKQLFVGDGVTLAQNASPVVGYNDENAQDAASSLLTHSNHTGLTFTYNDTTGQVLGVVDISNESINDLSDVDTTGIANGDLLVYNSTSGNFETGSAITATLTGNVTGNVDGDLTGSVFSDNSTKIIDGITGEIFGDVTGNVDGDLTGSVFSDNSTKIIDGITGEIFGDVTGNVTGNLTGNVTGNLLSSDGTLVLDSGTDGTDAVFPGNITFNNPVTINDGLDVSNTLRSNGLLLAEAGVVGDLQGSVFGDDSSIIVDGITGDVNAINLNTSSILATGNLLNISSEDGSSPLDVRLLGNEEAANISLFRTANTDIAGVDQFHARIQMGRSDPINGEVRQSLIFTSELGLFFSYNSENNFSASNYAMSLRENGLGIGPGIPTVSEALDVVGNIVATGSITSSSITLDNNSIRTINTNDNLQLSASGSGTVQLDVPTQITVGSAGGADAVPASPDIYFKINVDGTDYVVPGFAVS